MPHSLALATAIAVVADRSTMLVCENREKILQLPGLTIASEKKALDSLDTLLDKLDIADRPQLTLYLSHFILEEDQKKPLTVIVRIVHVETEDIPSHLGGRFRPLATLRTPSKASPLVQTVAQWITDQ